jgi:hypothetical protein
MHRKLPRLLAIVWLFIISHERLHILIAAVWLLMVSAGLRLLIQIASGDLAAFLGVLVIWLVDLSISTWYLLVILRPADDARVRARHIKAGVRDFHTPLLIAFLIIPGLWIGNVAHNPVLIAIASLLTMELLESINRMVPRRHPLEPLTIKQRIWLFRDRAVILLLATLAGVGLGSFVLWWRLVQSQTRW